MKICRRTCLLSLIVILCLGMLDQNRSVRAEAAGGKNGKKIVFQWAFCTLRKTDADQKPRVVAPKTTLISGDQIKFFVKPESPCYLYLIHQNSQHQLKVLYPLRFTQAAGQGTGSGKLYIPDGNLWFELDEHTGQEKYYLLASIQRLSDLENLIERYVSSDKIKKSELVDKIAAEIRNLRKRHLKFKTYTQKPVTIIGNLGGSEQTVRVHTKDIADYAVEISTTTFFSRTYTIDHRRE
jgi:Domain of unknown function (DUF4384)